jgi:hypothetical protein
MSRLARLQFIGPALVFAAVLSAECAAYALSRAPSSQILWYANLRLFGLFQKSHYVLATYVDVAYFQLLFVALPLILLASYGLFRRRALALAIASNLSCVYAAFLLYTSCLAELPRAASLVATGVSMRPDLLMGVVLLGSSLLSLVVSHIIYIGSLRQKVDDRQSCSVLFHPADHGRHAVLRCAD